VDWADTAGAYAKPQQTRDVSGDLRILGLSVYHGIQGRGRHFSDRDTGHEVFPVVLLGLALRLRDADTVFHHDHGHDPPHRLRCIGTGPVEGPAAMKADVSQLVRRNVHRIILERLPDADFALVADGQMAMRVDAVGAATEGQGSHFQRHVLQRDPGRDGIVVAERPVMLVGMPGRKTPSRLLEESLIVVHADAPDAQQGRGDGSQPRSQTESLDLSVPPP